MLLSIFQCYLQLCLWSRWKVPVISCYEWRSSIHSHWLLNEICHHYGSVHYFTLQHVFCSINISVFFFSVSWKDHTWLVYTNIFGIKKWPRLKCKNKGGWLQMHCSKGCDSTHISQAASVSWSACLCTEALHSYQYCQVSGAK